MQKNELPTRRPHKELDLKENKVSEIKEAIKHKPAKEESMADKQFTTENPLWNYAGQAQDAWKEIYGFQVKTTQVLVDQMMKWGQTYTDHVYSQVNDATKLSQEALKTGAHLTEELKKNYYHVTEKMTK